MGPYTDQVASSYQMIVSIASEDLELVVHCPPKALLFCFESSSS